MLNVLFKLKRFNLTVFCFAIVISSNAYARDFSEASLSYLNGDDFKVEPEQQQTITFEYVLAKNWFDMFLFIDNKNFSGAENGRYGEISPRITFATFDEQSIVKRISFSSTFERGKNDVESNLFGFGFDFNVSGFRYLNVNLYHRDDPDIAGSGNQITTTYAYPLKMGEIPILIDGYFDWTFNSDEQSDNFHFNPQIKIDMQSWMQSNQKWYIGIEYDYWKNKFGIRDSANFSTNQNTFSFLVKWHF